MADLVVRRARGRLVAAVLAAVLAAPFVGAGRAEARTAEVTVGPGRAAILFLPWPEEAGGDRALLARLGERGLTVGLTSPTVGGYSPEAFALDLSQGTRVPIGLLDGPAPRLRLVPGAPGRASDGLVIDRWAEVRRRAATAPAQLEPGSLGEAAERDGRRVAYRGPRDDPAAAVAADSGGRVLPAGGFDPAGEDGGGPPWRGADLLVARLPPGKRGLAELDRLLQARKPGDLVVVVRAPPPAAARAPLLATGVAGPSFGPGAGLWSATARRAGLVAATDVAPTVLERLGLSVPPAMAGRRIEARPGAGGSAAAIRLRDRLAAIVAARPPTLLALLAAWLASAGALALAAGRGGARAGLRLGLLAAVWFPGLCLATGALAVAAGLLPGVEAALLALGSVALAGATDRLLAWPRGPALPAVVVLCAYAADLALGSPLTSVSLVGPNPAGGARFFGVGNELEALLAVTALLGAGAAMSVSGLSPGRVAAGFAAVGLIVAAILGSGRLGADVGAVVTLGVGTALAAATALPAGRGRRAVATLAVLIPPVALGALALLDLATGGDAHLSRSVLDGGAPGLIDAVERRLGTQARLLASPVGAGVSGVSLAVLVALVLWRRRLFAPLARASARPLIAGLGGSLAAILAGAVANDSAPDVLAIGAVFGLLAAAYAGSEPARAGGRPERRAGARREERHGKASYTRTDPPDAVVHRAAQGSRVRSEREGRLAREPPNRPLSAELAADLSPRTSGGREPQERFLPEPARGGQTAP